MSCVTGQDDQCSTEKSVRLVNDVCYSYIVCLKIIDNHGSGYLGMAGRFNVHRQLPVSKETVISQHRRTLDKLDAPVKKLSLMSLYVKFYKLKSLTSVITLSETSVQNRILF